MENLISVIVPVYKVEKYLQQCVESLLAQTYKYLEILLVDDGSPDTCGQMCDNYALSDSRIKVLHKKNGGLSDARNVALDVAKGQYVMFVDSDDWVEPDFCQRAIEAAITHQADCVAFGFKKIYGEQDGRTNEVWKEEQEGFVAATGMMQRIIRNGFPLDYAWNKIYKRELFDGIRYPKGKLYEDIAVNYLICHRAHGFYLLSACTYNYYQRSDSIIARMYSEKAITDRFEIQKERFCFIKQYYPEYADESQIGIFFEAILGLCLIAADNPVREEMQIFYQTHASQVYSYKGEGLLLDERFGDLYRKFVKGVPPCKADIRKIDRFISQNHPSLYQALGKVVCWSPQYLTSIQVSTLRKYQFNLWLSSNPLKRSFSNLKVALGFLKNRF